MNPDDLYVDETQRRADLCSLDVLDTPAEERFDLITRLARATFDVPIALISLVSEDRQWFKSKQGLTVQSTSRAISFCGHTILESTPMVVEDALKDPRFAQNALVTGDPNIRFYAGAPIQGESGQRIGTLCLIDLVPRKLLEQDLGILVDLAALAELELRALQSGRARLGPAARPPEERRRLLDEITGSWNQKGLIELMEAGVAKCDANRRSMTTFVFEPFELARPSHPWKADRASDAIVAEIAQSIRRCLPHFDGMGRLDNERFALLMVGLDTASAAQESKFIQERIDGIADLRSVGIGLRIGHASIDAGSGTFSATELLEAACPARQQRVA